MRNFDSCLKPGMNTPAIYRIQVGGRLDTDWSDRMQGMNITRMDNGSNGTILVGRLKDQSALSSVMNTLYELHLPVISVDCLEDE